MKLFMFHARLEKTSFTTKKKDKFQNLNKMFLKPDGLFKYAKNKAEKHCQQAVSLHSHEEVSTNKILLYLCDY